MSLRILLITFMLTSQVTVAYSQAWKAKKANPKKGFTVVFYNVENLFDTVDDLLKNDDEFLPDGKKQWNTERYHHKLQNIAKVITGINPGIYPQLVGLCEIENRAVLEDLVNTTALRKVGYGIIHEESPDQRGIDVALLYQKKKFREIAHLAINISFPDDPAYTTRDILYVKGIGPKKDTLHILVNHWPSRWGGKERSEPKRMHVASVLANVTDSIKNASPGAKIIIIGDFNDHPVDPSLEKVLKATNNNAPLFNKDHFYNLMYNKSVQKQGSHCYKGEWGMLDQVIVSYSLINAKKGLSVNFPDAYVYNEGWILFYNEKLGTKVPNRTYGGNSYYGGFSDHLPVVVTFRIK